MIKLIDDKTCGMGMTLLTDDGPTTSIQDFKKYQNAYLYTFPLKNDKAKSWKLQTVKMRKVYDLLSSKDNNEEV